MERGSDQVAPFEFLYGLKRLNFATGEEVPFDLSDESDGTRKLFLAHIKRDSGIVHQIDWRKWEEIIAAAYRQAGYSVVFTQRSGDQGRDIIATKSDLLSVRYFDQVKA